MNLVLIGIAGAGKSTQGLMLSKQTGLPYLSTGDIFRSVAKENNELGRYVKETMKQGLLIPDKKTIPIVEKYLKKPQFRKGFILDGFPRTVNQAKSFRSIIDKVLYIYISDREALFRLAQRNESRADDDMKTILHRIEVFHKQTEPVLNYYQKLNKYEFVDGERTVKEVNRQVLYKLNLVLDANKAVKYKRPKKLIIGLTGLPGAGKTEAADYFAQRQIPVISFGDYINSYAKANKIAHTPENHKKLMEKFRAEHGMAALAKLSITRIKKILENCDGMVIDGIRSWDEYILLQKEFKNAEIVVFALLADREVRYDRIRARSNRNALVGRQRDINEIKITRLDKTMALSDCYVENNSSVQDLHQRLERLYQKFYFRAR